MPDQASGPPAAKAAPVSPATGLTAAEETTLATLQGKAAETAAGADWVEFRVTGESGHTEMHYGGVRLEQDWIKVPRQMAGPLQEAAADAGVTIEIREQEG